jgi:hypothetical protein
MDSQKERHTRIADTLTHTHTCPSKCTGARSRKCVLCFCFAPLISLHTLCLSASSLSLSLSLSLSQLARTKATLGETELEKERLMVDLRRLQRQSTDLEELVIITEKVRDRVSVSVCVCVCVCVGVRERQADGGPEKAAAAVDRP